MGKILIGVIVIFIKLLPIFILQTAKAFLSDMVKRGKGHIVTVGSLTGMLGTYKCTDYSATKHATMGFHESLLTELKVRNYLPQMLLFLLIKLSCIDSRT